MLQAAGAAGKAQQKPCLDRERSPPPTCRRSATAAARRLTSRRRSYVQRALAQRSHPAKTPCPALPYRSRDRYLGPSTSGTFRSEEHTSELQSQSNLVCRLLLEKK